MASLFYEGHWGMSFETFNPKRKQVPHGSYLPGNYSHDIFLERVAYVRGLCDSFDCRPDMIDVGLVFGQLPAALPVKDVTRKAIIAITNVKQPDELPVALNEQIVHALYDSISKIGHAEPREDTQAMQSANRIVSDASSALIRAISKKNRLAASAKLAAIRRAKEPDPYIAGINEVLKKKFFKFYNLERDCILFTTRRITLEYKNAEAGVDLSVPFGSFIVRLWLEDLAVTFEQHELNIPYKNVFHPFISSEGIPCFGSLLPDYLAAVERGSYGEVLEVVQRLLIPADPTDGEPYVSLQVFSDHYAKITGMPKKRASPPAPLADEAAIDEWAPTAGQLQELRAAAMAMQNQYQGLRFRYETQDDENEDE